MEFELRIVNWNIGGAKYLETREPGLLDRMQKGLDELINKRRPHIICLQEFTQFSETGRQEDATDVMQCPQNYARYQVPLIDTARHSHQGKWNKVRRDGKWPLSTFLSQGNAIFVRKDLRVFPVWSLPGCGTTYAEWRAERLQSAKKDQEDVATPSTDDEPRPEDIILQTGFYRGTRDTEPRAATVLHVVIDRALNWDLSDPGESAFDHPLDLFVVNTHLTTLTREREGIPAVDAKASQRRLGQLDILFDDVISEYNLWSKDDYRIRGAHVQPLNSETHWRHPPLWILCGDFNFTHASAEYRYIAGRNFLDLDSANPPKPTKAVGKGNKPTLTLDYVFVGPAFEAIDPLFMRDAVPRHRVPHDPPLNVSDHYPIEVALTVTVQDDLTLRCRECKP